MEKVARAQWDWCRCRQPRLLPFDETDENAREAQRKLAEATVEAFSIPDLLALAFTEEERESLLNLVQAHWPAQMLGGSDTELIAHWRRMEAKLLPAGVVAEERERNG